MKVRFKTMRSWCAPAGELFVGSEEYGWVALNFVQGRLVVEKTQREKVPEPIGTEVTNVVAKSDGIIRRLELVDGYPRVVPGQYGGPGPGAWSAV